MNRGDLYSLGGIAVFVLAMAAALIFKPEFSESWRIPISAIVLAVIIAMYYFFIHRRK